MPKYYRPLNQRQIQLLKVLFKFRFITVELINKSGRKSELDVIRRRLKVLLEQGYIGRYYDGSFRLQNKPAIYYLDKDGISRLKQLGFDSRALHPAYGDKTAKPQFIDHNLNVMALYIKFRQLYPAVIFATKSELHSTEQLPKLLPDAFLNFNGSAYFLDCLEESIQLIGFRKRLIGYLDFFEEEYDKPPKLLVICTNPRIEKSVQKLAARLSEYDFDMFTTSLKALMENQPDSRIWTFTDEPEELTSLI